MNRFLHFITVAILLGVGAYSTFAQDDRHKVEIFAGYSFHHSDTGLNEATGRPREESSLDFDSHGFNASITGNLRRYVGLKFDLSTHSSERIFVSHGETLGLRLRTTQFLGGVQVKNNGKDGSRLRPFAHLLAGVAHQRQTPTTSARLVPAEAGSLNDFAMAIGGGIDVNVSKRVAIRLIQLDYNPIFRKDHHFEIGTLAGRTQNNIRVGIGIVIH